MARAVLVTGGNAGIGAALCRQLAAEHGCRVLMGARNAERGEAAAAAIAKALPDGCGGSVELVVMDVADDASVGKAAVEVADRLGGDKLYAVVNNAGKSRSWYHTTLTRLLAGQGIVRKIHYRLAVQFLCVYVCIA